MLYYVIHNILYYTVLYYLKALCLSVRLLYQLIEAFGSTLEHPPLVRSCSDLADAFQSLCLNTKNPKP